MRYIKDMLTNWGIASDYVPSTREDKYVAMYSIYIQENKFLILFYNG